METIFVSKVSFLHLLRIYLPIISLFIISTNNKYTLYDHDKKMEYYL